ncbi:drug/metabolite transporter (DMT)-like permease [Herbihabitans rhizosphaerae]|uniref:Drug/metabolite transporter (DMT)-like permease n=1 Tax=Herbihabitans rhizosphaerae TaxID=1872711 RepID=A0A4Q7KXR7_9PSEU|nr:DMT family transporter [Herbihabitans rhizosphaerae]RZS41130.1 drug/metabolite transporter (DMT)-like permease [Herbihabitans rhizosphaerae]
MANDQGANRKAIAAAAVTVLLWASSFVVIRDATNHLHPGAMALGRMFTASVVLVLFLVIRREGLPGRGAWPGILISGVLWFGGYMIVLNWGEQLVDAGTAAMIVNVGPMLMALLGGWLLGEGFPPRLFAGIAVSFAGAIVVGFSMSGGEEASALGVVLCLLAAASYAAGVVAQKPALRHASPLQATTFGCVIGMIACLPFAGQLVSQVADAPASAVLGTVYLGVFPTALAFTTWAYALHRTTAGKMGSTTYVVPAIVVIMSWIFLDEVPGWLSLAGGALCLVGVAVSRWRPKPEAVEVEPEPAAAR